MIKRGLHPSVRLYVLVASVTCLALGSNARGATINVTTTADEADTPGNCSLREAVRSANTDSGIGGCTGGTGPDDTINLPAGTYTLSLSGDEGLGVAGDLNVTQTVTVVGASASTTIIDGNNTDRVFAADSVNLTLRNLTIQHGNPTYHGLSSASFGGGISMLNGSLTLENCIVANNTALSGGGVYHMLGTLALPGSDVRDNTASADGGGLYLSGVSSVITGCTIAGNDAGSTSQGGGLFLYSSAAAVTHTITDTTISGNTAQSGAGIVNANHSTLTLRNATLSGNLGTSAGGGLFQNFGDAITLENVTIANNVAAGGGLYVGGGSSVTVQNSILADNRDPSTAPDDCAGPVTSSGYNLVETPGGCVFGATGDRTGVDPSLGVLASNGGPTFTHAPGVGSVAIDGGNPATVGSGGGACPAVDQRGVSRPVGAACDIGAVESSPSGPTTSTVSTTTVTTTTDSTPTTTTPPPCAALTEASVKVKRYAAPAGNQQLILRATLPFGAGVPPTLDPSMTGVQVRIDDRGAGAPLLDLTGAASVPAGARGAACGTKDGWKRLAYLNKSGAMQPPVCPAGSAMGVRTVTLTDRRKKGKGIRVALNAPKTSLLPPVGPLAVTIVLGDDPAAAAGLCGTFTFDATACGVKGKSWVCR